MFTILTNDKIFEFRINDNSGSKKSELIAEYEIGSDYLIEGNTIIETNNDYMVV